MAAQGFLKTVTVIGLASPVAAILLAVAVTNWDADRGQSEVTEFDACSITEKFVSDRLKAPTTKFPRGNCSAAKTDKSWQYAVTSNHKTVSELCYEESILPLFTPQNGKMADGIGNSIRSTSNNIVRKP